MNSTQGTSHHRATFVQPRNSRQASRNHNQLLPPELRRNTICVERPGPTILKTSPLLKETFVTLVQLSTKLVDPSWDSAILEQCTSSLPH